MARYVDGFVIPVPKKKVSAYQRMAKLGAKAWMKAGALEYHECVGDDLNVKMGKSFPAGIKVKPSETVFFSWIVFKSRAHRDAVNKRVMKEMEKQMGPEDIKNMPFDAERMLYGGFKSVVDA